MDLGKILGTGDGTPGFSDLVDLLTKHKDDLAATAQIARELPRLLALFSTGLAEAGTHAAAAGNALTGASGATGRLGNSAATVAEISGSLGGFGDLIGKAADEIAKVPLMGAPAANLTGAAAGIAWINSVGNLAGFLGPFLVGYLKDFTGSTAAGLYFLAAVLVIGAVAVLTVPAKSVNR